jgi:hypothetical protein
MSDSPCAARASSRPTQRFLLTRPLAVPVSVQMIRWACGALRPGRFDPFALLVLRCLRLAFHPLLWGGLVVAALRGFLDNELVRLDTPGTSSLHCGPRSSG